MVSLTHFWVGIVVMPWEVFPVCSSCDASRENCRAFQLEPSRIFAGRKCTRVRLGEVQNRKNHFAWSCHIYMH